MKTIALLLALSAVAAAAAPIPEAARIDAILAEAWEKQGVKPNPPATDEVFLRRIYLDVVGRVPTVQEARLFLTSQDPQKRMKLIDQLLASDGYVSNFFNYYADILRLQTDMRGAKLTGQAYANWLKEALRKNQTYDGMVRELLTTDGSAWESGAIGFYMRDRGMPLDHLAATVQIFLGTRIECAQCHNHPFDKWTQKDYYQMAAFTYGMDTKLNYAIGKKPEGDNKRLRGKEAMAMRETMREIQESVRQVSKELRYTQISETDKLPKLPHDYQYKDAKPGETILPKTLFGHDAVPAAGESRLDAFANWMTSPENPRFTTVIANRLWKKVMGMGLIEPVDELTDSTVPSHPQLMTYLEELMVAKKYNLKSYLRVLLNSDVYQRMPSTKDVMLGESYAFTGPLMRRMSAEQVWDSIATLMHGNIDGEGASVDEGAVRKLAALGKVYDTLTSQNPKELAERIRAAGGGASNPDKEARIKELTERMTALRREGKKEEAAALSQQINRLRQGERQDAFVAVLGEEAAEEFQQSMRGDKTAKREMTKVSLSREEVRKLMAEGGDKKAVRAKMEEMRRNANIVSGATRASDLPSPAPRGHMLRIFGQSDRETIENASRESAVPQALSMLNGPIADALMNPVTALSKEVAAAGALPAQLDTLYLGLLCRYPTNNERQVLSQVVAERGDNARADIVHALLNTGEFLFVK
jgi:hypothetical protein